MFYMLYRMGNLWHVRTLQAIVSFWNWFTTVALQALAIFQRTYDLMSSSMNMV